MLLGGLWHGAAWTFVIWGAYHGLLLVIYRRSAAVWDAWPVWFQRGLTFFLVIVGWTLFRAPDLPTAVLLLERMLVPSAVAAGELMTGAAVLGVAIVIAACLAHFGKNTFEMAHRPRPVIAGALALLFILCLVRIYGITNSPFLYFQF
jgi:alginate O-acetyltransferase complex protein AlgI